MNPTFHRPIWDPWNYPREEGGWCCSVCKTVLEQEDFLGVRKANLFLVRGYKCPVCGYQHGEGIAFNWRVLPIPVGKVTGGA
ncbi:MAG: hypothetical protein PHH09_04015 [Methanoregulaceae archaeon]|nr:hypothetical protein [Methanoregulaceae archaeon]